jgi:uroporphyrin-III C-methyltransferase / precorrin-2 dehydrogenase / sirohydrochlorin ferrochelatase
MTRCADLPTAADFARAARRHGSGHPKGRGEVYLVGAGPGDPELLTLRALKLMQCADIALYDNLISQEVLDLLPPSTTRIYVGKRRAHHTMRQEEINELLVRHAKAGKRVLRLKGGDPFIFGRGGEEIGTLSANRIPFEVVPGITAALGVAAYAGIPLTHRDYAQSCLFVAGQLKDRGMDLDWPALVRPRQTIVVYMGLPGLPRLCEQLIAHGMKQTTPAAVVQRGTFETQRVISGTIRNLPKRAADAKLQGPTLIIIGGVVRLRNRLNWFAPD